MRTEQVIAYFKSQEATAKALGIKQPSVSDWGDYPPDLRQLQLERITKGKLKAEPGCKERALGLATPTEKAA